MYKTSLEDLKYNGTITIYDDDMLTDIAQKYNVKHFNIAFAKKHNPVILKKFESPSLKPFTDSDLSFLRDKISWNKVSHTVHVDGIVLYKMMSYNDVINIISYVLNNYKVRIEPIYKLPKDYIDDNTEDNPEYKHIYEHNMTHSRLVTMSTVCAIVDNNIDLVVTSLKSINNTTNIFDTMRYYCNIIKYIKHALTISVPIKYHINKISVLLSYVDNKNEYPYIDTIQMFKDIEITNEIPKLCIQSDILDTVKANTMPQLYIKTTNDSTNNLKNNAKYYNAISIYFGETFDVCYLLNNINIFEYGAIKFNYDILDPTVEYDEIYEHVIAHCKSFFNSIIIKKLCFTDYASIPTFDSKRYCYSICDINSSLYISNCTNSYIEDIVAALEYKTLSKLKFTSFSSAEINMFPTYNMWFEHIVMYIQQRNKQLTYDTVLNNYAPTIHAGCTVSNITVNFSGVPNVNVLKFLISYVILSMKSLTSMNIITNAVSGFNDVSVKDLRERAINYPKQVLKELQNTDPKLFGNRIDPKATNKDKPPAKTYSNMCQKPEQRPMVISEQIYNKLVQEMPLSVIKMQNQTYPANSLYLFCPDKTFNILNFHNIPQQMCIVRCTTKQSNNTQFTYCANQLGATYSRNKVNLYENQMIIKYNPIISVDRKCQLPYELQTICSNHVLRLISVLPSQNLYNRIKDITGMNAFILERVEDKGYYNVKTLVIDNTKDTTLVLATSKRPNVYFLVEPIGAVGKYKYYNIKEHPEFYDIIVRHSLKTEAYHIFFNFITTFIPMLHDIDMKDEWNVYETFQEFNKKIELTYVLSNNMTDIMGVVCNRVIYFTPRYTIDSGVMNVIKTTKMITAIERLSSGIYILPTSDELLLSGYHPTIYYKDQQLNKIVMYNIYNYDIMIQPEDVPEETFGKNIITIDQKALMQHLKIADSTINVQSNIVKRSKHQTAEQSEFSKYVDVVNRFAFMCYSNDIPITRDNIINYMKQFNVYSKKEHYLLPIPLSKNAISFTRSKVDDGILDKYFSNYTEGNEEVFVKLFVLMINDKYVFDNDQSNILVITKPLTPY